MLTLGWFRNRVDQRRRWHKFQNVEAECQPCALKAIAVTFRDGCCPSGSRTLVPTLPRRVQHHPSLAEASISHLLYHQLPGVSSWAVGCAWALIPLQSSVLQEGWRPVWGPAPVRAPFTLNTRRVSVARITLMGEDVYAIW